MSRDLLSTVDILEEQLLARKRMQAVPHSCKAMAADESQRAALRSRHIVMKGYPWVSLAILVSALCAPGQLVKPQPAEKWGSVQGDEASRLTEVVRNEETELARGPGGLNVEQFYPFSTRQPRTSGFSSPKTRCRPQCPHITTQCPFSCRIPSLGHTGTFLWSSPISAGLLQLPHAYTLFLVPTARLLLFASTFTTSIRWSRRRFRTSDTCRCARA